VLAQRQQDDNLGSRQRVSLRCPIVQRRGGCYASIYVGWAGWAVLSRLLDALKEWRT
jgi:hypothetical protein